MVDYIAIEKGEPQVLADIAKGLRDGALQVWNGAPWRSPSAPRLAAGSGDPGVRAALQDVLHHLPHVAAAPPKGRQDAKVETQAAEQIASALLARRAGSKVPIPTWVVAGFGRATSWRAAPAASSFGY